MKRFAMHLAIGFSLLLPTMGQAEMSVSQMELAHLALALHAVQLPDAQKNCPSIDFPRQFKNLESKLDSLQTQFQTKKACVNAYLAATESSALRAFLDKRYPSATGSQISTLLVAWSATFEPQRESMKNELKENEERLEALARPFHLLRESKRALTRALDKCPEPKHEDWTSVAAARNFQAQYEVYEGCLQEAKHNFMDVSAADLVAMSWSKESDFVQSILLLESGSMISGLVASATRRHAKYTDLRRSASNYIRANTKE